MKAVLLAALLLGRLAAAWAHGFEPAVLDLNERQPGVFDVTWKPPPGGSAVLAPELPASCRPVARAASPVDDGPRRWRVDCGPEGLAGQRLAVSGLDGVAADAIARIGWVDGRTTVGVLSAGDPSFLVRARAGSGSGAPAHGVVVWRSCWLGVGHIAGGA